MTLDPVIWEHEPLRATASFQEQIPPSSTTEIAIFILWARLSTRLPAHLTRPDGSRYASGTEFEFEDAIQGYRQQGHPDILVYRKQAVPMILLGPEARERVIQKEALDAFMDAWFRAPDGALTAAFHPFDTPAQFEELLETHLHRLLTERLPPPPAPPEGPTGPPLWTEGSPFRGLEVFDPEHAPVFCGRTQAVSEVLEALRQQAAAGRAFVLVSGQSGVGKSSLVRAGVLPSLTQPGVIEGIGLWRQALLRPSDSTGDLCDGVAAALLRAEALPELATAGVTPQELAQLLRDTAHAAVPLIRTGLAQAAAEVQRREDLAGPPTARLVLVVDQLEEIFSRERVTPTERAGLIAVLSALARSGQVWVIATLRSDFAPRGAELPELLALKEGAGQYELRPPTPAELSQLIRQPARLAGLHFEAEVDTAAPLDDVLRDAALQGPEALPLLEFTLQALYEQRTAQGILTHAAYTALGGLEGALARRAEAVFADLPAAVQAALPGVLSALVSVGLGDPDSVTRRRAPLDPLLTMPERRALIEACVAARLFVADRADDGTAVISVVHEALLQHWPRVQAWLAANRDFLRARARIATATALWQEAGQAADLLLPAGRRLQQAADLLATRRDDLSGELITYIERSVKKRGRERCRTWTAAAVVMLMFIGAGLWYWDAYVRPHVAYYASAISRWGSPEGVGRVTEAATRHRPQTRKFHRRGRLGPVERVEFVNGSGTCPWLYGIGMPAIPDQPFPTPGSLDSLNTRVCQITFERDATGRVITEKSFDRDGTLVFEAQHDPDRQTVYYKNAAGFAHPLVASGAAYVKFVRATSGPEAGLDKEVRYFDQHGKPQPDAEGSFGLRNEFDERGLPIQGTFLGPDGAPRPLNSWGVAQVKFRNDKLGNPTEIAMFDADGNPTLGTFGAARMTRSYDAYGNTRELTFLDLDDRPVIASMWGCAKTTLAHDAQGNAIEQAYFDADGHLMLNEKRGFARVTQTFDARGNLTSTAYFGPNGDLMLHRKEGFAIATRVYDAHGNLTSRAYFGPDGEPMLYQKRYAQVSYRYDSAGHFVEAILWDLLGQRLPPSNVTIVTVEPESQAAQLGLQSGDIIFAYAGIAVPNSVTFNKRARAQGEGLRELRILRRTEMLTLQVAPGTLGVTLEDHEIVVSQEP